MPSVADIFSSVHLDLETGTFEVDAQKFAEAAGAKAGQSMSSAIGSKLKSLAGAAIGAGLGAAASMALTGANELDAATRQLQADTGMTATEAGVAEKAIAGMYQNNLQGFDQIGAAMAVVINGLGLTGAAADAATGQFLAFSTATGQDAAEAVTSIKGDLAAWNLTAADAGPLMDKLVASHQKYGVAVTADEASLQALAPAMQAANMSVDDGIALLNLFQMAGISAAKAPAALAIAVKQLKPGESLNDLIAKISAISDPTLRAQAAMKDFGARAGTQLAQAIKPGMDSLAAYTTSLGNTAGATQKAADEIESSFGNKAVKALHEVQGALASFGTSLGDVAIVAALVGPKLTMALTSTIGAVGGLLVPKITAGLTADLMPWMSTGTKIGTVLGAAAGPAFMIAMVAAAAEVAIQVEPGLHDLGVQIHEAIFGKQDTLGDVGAWLDSLPWPIGPVGAPDWAKGSADAGAGAKQVGTAIATNLAEGVGAAGPDVAAAIARMLANTTGPQGLAAARGLSSIGAGLVGGIVAGVDANLVLADQAGIDASIAFGKGAESTQSSIAKDGQALIDAWLHPINLAKVKTELAGALHAKALVDGLNAGDPAVRGAAEQEAIDILTYLDALKGPAFVAGQNAAWSMASGMSAILAKLPDSPVFASIRKALTTMTGTIYGVMPTYQQQVAKLAVDPGTIAGNQDLAAAIKLLGGGMDYTAGKAAGLSDAVKTKLTNAFDAAKTAATTFFDALHAKNLKAIQDTKDLANAQIDSQITAVNAQVQAAKDTLQATQDAEQEASLRAAVAANPTDVGAQQSLANFLSQQNINQMEAQATAKTDALTAQKTKNDALATNQTTAENARYKAQVAAWDVEFKALQTQLDKQPKAWSTMNAEILKLLKDAEVPYAKAGTAQGAAYMNALKKASGGLISLPSVAALGGAAQAPKYVAAPPVTAGATAALALAGGGSQPAVVRIEIGGKKLIDYLDEHLAYIRRP